MFGAIVLLEGALYAQSEILSALAHLLLSAFHITLTSFPVPKTAFFPHFCDLPQISVSVSVQPLSSGAGPLDVIVFTLICQL